jgi:hypothetical protein
MKSLSRWAQALTGSLKSLTSRFVGRQSQPQASTATHKK